MMTPLSRPPLALRRHAGFSLVELMVSIVIGLLALMFAMNMVGGAEKTRRSSLGGSDEMQNGMLGMFSLSNDAGDAGFGLNDPIVAGCDTLLTDSDGKFTLSPATRGTTTVHPLAPVIIESHGSSPDRITFYSGSASGGTSSVILGANYASGTGLTVADDPSFAFNTKDVFVVAPTSAGGQCAMAEVSGVDATLKTISMATSGMRLNHGSLGTTFTQSAARVYNLGQIDDIAFRSWSVATGGYLQMQELRRSADATTVADNIVSIKAQYGFDTRTGANFTPELGLKVNTWSATMIDADGSGTVGDAADYQHIAAVRLAVVARSKAFDRTAVNGTCTATKDTDDVLKVFKTDAGGATAVPITISLAVAGDPIDWHCYRYRTFETVVTLRNATWRP